MATRKVISDYGYLGYRIQEETGLNIANNKALKRYYNSGKMGVLMEIYDVMEGMPITEDDRRTMAMLVYNRRMNGSKIPGTTVQRDDGGNYIEFMENAEVRSRAFQEVRPATLRKWNKAIKLIDEYKEHN